MSKIYFVLCRLLVGKQSQGVTLGRSYVKMMVELSRNVCDAMKILRLSNFVFAESSTLGLFFFRPLSTDVTAVKF